MHSAIPRPTVPSPPATAMSGDCSPILTSSSSWCSRAPKSPAVWLLMSCPSSSRSAARSTSTIWLSRSPCGAGGSPRRCSSAYVGSQWSVASLQCSCRRITSTVRRYRSTRSSARARKYCTSTSGRLLARDALACQVEVDDGASGDACRPEQVRPGGRQEEDVEDQREECRSPRPGACLEQTEGGSGSEDIDDDERAGSHQDE